MSREVVQYGPDRAQVAEVLRPAGVRRSDPIPVVVLLHGGFWRQKYTKGLMRRLARTITTEGWMAYNVEYRRVGRFGHGGWPATFEDVSDAIDALSEVPGADLHHVATCGHSAGGHLALWSAGSRATGDPTRLAPLVHVAAVASLGGVVDLDEAARQGVGRGAVEALMGGGPDEVPDRYRLGSPAALLPLGKPQLLLHGLDDTTVPPSLSEHYAQRAVDLGDPALYVPLPDVGHMAMVSGRGTPWVELMAWLDRVLGSSPPRR